VVIWAFDRFIFSDNLLANSGFLFKNAKYQSFPGRLSWNTGTDMPFRVKYCYTNSQSSCWVKGYPNELAAVTAFTTFFSSKTDKIGGRPNLPPLRPRYLS
jgi:hypothetical protein